MKNYLFLLGLTLVFVSCNKNNQADCVTPEASANCIDTSLIDPTALCTEEYDPVCGCDGETYSNACNAQVSGVTSYTQGTCCD